MRRILTRLIGSVIFAGILLLIFSPPVSACPISKVANSIQANNYQHYQQEHAIPSCCPSTDCAPPHSNDVNVVLPPNLPTLKTVFYIAQVQNIPTLDPSFNQIDTSLQNPAQELPLSLYTGYHCRNSLNPEDPASLS